MKGSDPKERPKTLKKLMVLGDKKGTIKLKDLAREMGLSADETLSFLRQVFPAGTGIETYFQNKECLIDIDADSLQYMLPLSPVEWIQLHQILHQYKMRDGASNHVIQNLKKKMTENGPMKVIMELLNQLDLWEQQLTESQQQMISQLDQAVDDKMLIRIETTSSRLYNVYPCKVLHLEGKLSLVAEDSQDHCLVVISLHELGSLTYLGKNGYPKVSSFEIDEFIAAIRAMNEKETRLILKIHDPQSVNLFPDHHFLGKPCMITNPNGDLIWAAYVEPCEDLFEWLITLGSNVEILDPTKFKDDFLIYCEEKLRKIA